MNLHALNLMNSTLLGVFFCITAIAVSIWSYFFINRSEDKDRRINETLAFIILHAYLMGLFAVNIDPGNAHWLYYPMFFAMLMILASTWVIQVCYAILKVQAFKTMRMYFIVIDTLLTLLIFTNPFHFWVDSNPAKDLIEPNVGMYIIVFYTIAKLMIGLFLYYAFPKNRNRTLSIILITISIIYMIYTSYVIQFSDLQHYFVMVILSPFYFILLIEISSQNHSPVPPVLKSALFEHTQFKIAIFNHEANLTYLSPNLESIRPMVSKWSLDDLLVSNPTGNLLELPHEQYLQWSCIDLHQGYLVNFEDVTDFFRKIREKDQMQKELSNKQTLMAAQSNMEKEMMLTDYRLKLHETIEQAGQGVLLEIKHLLEKLDPHHVTRQQADEIKIWSRYFKRKSLFILKDNPQYLADESMMAFQELLEVSQPGRFSILQTSALANYEFQRVHQFIQEIALLTLPYTLWMALTIQHRQANAEVRLQITADAGLSHLMEELSTWPLIQLQLDQDNNTLICRLLWEV